MFAYTPLTPFQMVFGLVGVVIACGPIVLLLYWAFKNPDQIIGDGNTWGGAFGCFGIILAVLAVGMFIAYIGPIVICALVGWFGGKAIAWGIRCFFIG